MGAGGFGGLSGKGAGQQNQQSAKLERWAQGDANTASSADLTARKPAALLRIEHRAHEKNRLGLLVLNNKQKRTIDGHGRWRPHHH